ncbi:MAG TPA: FliA/WhiG family RNA polymerase sigma factor [Armatimonadota bacterium]|nr:FliA/WhiG family RNA polymerase sigma factor [Armatimonadota bacterium]
MGETERLWQQYIDGRSPDVRRTLIESYAPLARYVVDRLNLMPGPALEYDDLLSQAVVGLIDAVDRFDPTRGIKFETYAYYRIRGAVMDMLRELDWLPRSIRQREAQLSRAYAALENRLTRPPTDIELARELGVTLDQLDTLAQEVALQTMQSLDEAVAPHIWETGTVGDLIADRSTPSPEDELERQAEREIVARAIDSLPDAERTVVSLYYYEGLTLKEIGSVMGVTESRACQVHGKAMLRLRARVQSLLKPPAEKARILSRGGQSAVKAAKFSSDAAGA